MRILTGLLTLSLAAAALAAEGTPDPKPVTELTEALSRGLERQFNSVEIPVGSTKADDELKASLKSLEPQGLATVREPGPDDPAGTVVVSPTKLALDHKDAAESRRNMVVVRMGACEIQSVIKNVPYTGKKLPQSADYKFVMGTYKVTPTPLAKKIDAKCDTKEHKFRAIVEVNPFSGKHILRRADWGEPDEDGWKTSNVE